MKRFFQKSMSALLALMMVLGALVFEFWVFEKGNCVIKAEALEELKEGYYSYTVDENGYATITEVDKSISGDIIIPSEVGGHPLKAILSAFQDCINITSVTIPDCITKINIATFNGCTGLKYVTIPDSVTHIGWVAFGNCSKLESVTIPESVSNIYYQAFKGCSGLKSITVDSKNTEYSSDEHGVLFNKDKTKLIQYPAGNTAASYSVPESVKEFEGTAFFDCDNLTNITIPVTQEIIYLNTFEGCDNLEKVVIPDTVKAIDENAFFECKALSDVYYYGTENEWNSIDICAGNDCLINADIHFNYSTGNTVDKDESVGEFIKTPTTSKINYGETLILHADFTNIPADAKIEWSVDGDGVTIKPSADGKTCAITSEANGYVEISAKYVDANGVEHVSGQKIESKAGIWQIIVSFFKNLFGMDRTIEQTVEF